MKYLRAFVRFWWDFIVGDDWRVALGVGVALFATWLFAHEGANVWWLLPVAVVLILAGSLRRETRTTPPSGDHRTTTRFDSRASS